MTSAQLWIAGARPRTLPAAIAPVLVGSAVAVWHSSFSPLLALLALIVALALQVGVNYANDYSDGIRGTDEVRVGPVRLVGAGLASAAAVKRAAFISFAVAAAAGLVLTLLTGFWVFLPIGALAIVSAWFYTGGAHPYGYLGLGEVFVFVWFGLAAVLGTAFAQTGEIDALGLLLAIASGAYSCALLAVNNLRDIPGDTLANKRTLAVRLGDERSRSFYNTLLWTGPSVSLLIAFLALTGWQELPALAALGALAAVTSIGASQQVKSGAKGADLIRVLGATGRSQVIWAGLTSLGIATQAFLR